MLFVSVLNVPSCSNFVRYSFLHLHYFYYYQLMEAGRAILTGNHAVSHVVVGTRRGIDPALRPYLSTVGATALVPASRPRSVTHNLVQVRSM